MTTTSQTRHSLPLHLLPKFLTLHLITIISNRFLTLLKIIIIRIRLDPTIIPTVTTQFVINTFIGSGTMKKPFGLAFVFVGIKVFFLDVF